MLFKKKKTQNTSAAPSIRRSDGSLDIEITREGTTNQSQLINDSIIAQRAEEIWRAEGYPEGREVEHWLQAERELRGK